MENLFSQVLNMSLTASVVILFVLGARMALKKVPKIFSYALWSVVLFRLLCPVSLPSPVSVLEVASPQVTYSEGITSSVTYIPAQSLSVQPDRETAVSAEPVQKQEETRPISTMTIVTYVWLAGVAIMAFRSAAAYMQLQRRLVGALLFRGNVYLADHIPTPFVTGVLSPRIYLPSDIPSRERMYILAHERHHIRRGDHIIKLLAYCALSIHWFNPLVWVAFVQAGKDMEMSCDEAVIKRLGPQIRADYSASLLRLATGQRIIAGTPLAFGEGDTKGRIRNMAKWKKPKLWVSALCLLLCVTVLIACGMNPESEAGKEVTMNGFHVTIPEEYTVENNDHGVIFRTGETLIGGIARRISSFPLIFNGAEANGYEWLEALGLPLVDDWTVRITNSDDVIGTDKGALVIDCHPVGDDLLGRFHFLWLGDGDEVYDLWFDKTLVSEKAIERILDTAYLKGASESAVEVEGLPEGYFFSEGEHEGYVEILFYGGSNIVGGVTSYPIPEGVYDPEDTVFEWLEEVGIPDFEDTSLANMGGITAPGGGWIAEFTSDVPEGVAPTVDRRHHFYPIGDTLYDIWFDMMLLDFATSEEIRQAVKLPDMERSGGTETLINTAGDITSETEPSVAADRIIAGAGSIQYGNLIMTLPENYSCREDSGKVILEKDGTDVGSITCWAAPDLNPYDDMAQWVRALGLPEAQESDDPIGYMMGGSLYGDLEAEFFNELYPEKLNVEHHFFIDGDLVYDVSYDQNTLSDSQAEKFLKTIQISGVPVVTPPPSEDEGLEKCRAVLEMVQSGSYHIASEKWNEGYVALNDSSSTRFYQHDGNWLSITEIPESGGSSIHAYMEVDGIHYNNEGNAWDENGQPNWEERDPVTEVRKPWLATFHWNEDVVAYIDTQYNGGEECVMLRIDEPYPYGTDNSESYFVNFYFVDGGAFLRADLQVNMFLDNAFTETESIVSMDAETVAAQIETEYLRATESQ